jgi:hypothetical protein
MNKNVQGLPKNVPIADARTFPRNKIASNAAISKCNPTNGVKEAATPLAIPAAIDADVPGIRTIR